MGFYWPPYVRDGPFSFHVVNAYQSLTVREKFSISYEFFVTTIRAICHSRASISVIIAGP